MGRPARAALTAGLLLAAAASAGGKKPPPAKRPSPKPSPSVGKGSPAAGKPRPAGKAPAAKPAAAARKSPSPGSTAGRAAASAVPAAAPVLAPTLLRTDAEYRPGLDLKADAVAVGRQGASWEEIDQAIRSWKTAGNAVHRALSIGSDPGALYSSGRADGTPRPEDVARDASDRPLGGEGRPAVVPTAAWLAHLKEHIRRAVDSGSAGIWAEEVFAHAAGGYSGAFKAAARDAQGRPWEDPASSPAAFFRAARLKSDLHLGALNELLRFTRDYAREKQAGIRFILPAESSITCAADSLVSPLAAASRLPVDAVIARLRYGSAAAPVTSEGVTGALLFETSWAAYSYFANLMEGVEGRPLYFQTDPWEEGDGAEARQRRYRQMLAASLFFAQARGYEVAPRPERLASPSAAGGAGDLAGIAGITTALRELPAAGAPGWEGATEGVGVLALDTMMWQRGGPGGSSMSSFYGLALPLLKRGIPVQVVPGERAADRAYMARHRVLLLSYDMQKPPGPELNQALADWVKAGGILVLLGGEDPYNDIGEWWNRSGYAGPTDHLLRVCGAGVSIPERRVLRPGERFAPVLKAEAEDAGPAGRRLYAIPLGAHAADGRAVYVRFSDLRPDRAPGVRLGRVRLVEGERVRADFTAGSAGERPFLVEDAGSRVESGHRTAERAASFVYRWSRLGADAVLQVELGGEFLVSVASGQEPGVRLQPAARGFSPLRVPSSHPLVTYPLVGAEGLYRVEGVDESPAWTAPIGQGHVIYCGVPAAFGAESGAGAGLVRAIVQQACQKAGIEYREGPLVARRGPFTIAHALGRAVQLKGLYLDLFHPVFPLVEDPQLPFREPVFFKQVNLSGRVPALLHGSHRAVATETTASVTRLSVDGPQDSSGILRLYPAGQSLVSAEAVTPSGRSVPVDARIDGRTVVVTYPQQAEGMVLTLRWIRPEARLTK